MEFVSLSPAKCIARCDELSLLELLFHHISFIDHSVSSLCHDLSTNDCLGPCSFLLMQHCPSWLFITVSLLTPFSSSSFYSDYETSFFHIQSWKTILVTQQSRVLCPLEWWRTQYARSLSCSYVSSHFLVCGLSILLLNHSLIISNTCDLGSRMRSRSDLALWPLGAGVGLWLHPSSLLWVWMFITLFLSLFSTFKSTALFRSSANLEIPPRDRSAWYLLWTFLMHPPTKSCYDNVFPPRNALALYHSMNGMRPSFAFCLMPSRSAAWISFSSPKNLLQNSVTIFSQLLIESYLSSVHQVKAFIVNVFKNSFSIILLSPLWMSRSSRKETTCSLALPVPSNFLKQGDWYPDGYGSAIAHKSCF